MHTLAAFFFELLYSSNKHPLDGIPTILTIAIFAGSAYGCLRLILDVGRFLRDNFQPPPPLGPPE